MESQEYSKANDACSGRHALKETGFFCSLGSPVCLFQVDREHAPMFKGNKERECEAGHC